MVGGGITLPDEPNIESSGKMQTNSNSYFIYFLATLSAVGGFLFGYDTGIVSGAMVFVKDDFKLDHVWQEVIVGITIGTAWLFASLAGWLTQSYGRKPVVIGASIVFTLSSIVMAVAPNKWVLLIGRAIVGAAIGLASMVVPMYIAEVAPKEIRGSLVTLNNCFVTGGQFVAAITAGLLSKLPMEVGWRLMLGLAGVPSAIQFVGFLFMPESPRWLARKGQEEKAQKALQRIRGRDAQIEEEFKSILEINKSENKGAENASCRSILLQVFQDPPLRKALIVGSSLQMFQQLAGINTVMYYSATIIQMSGVYDNSEAVWLASTAAAVNFFCTFIGFFLVERIGRRKLTLVSLAGVVASLGMLAAAFQVQYSTAPDINRNITDVGNSSCYNHLKCVTCMDDSGCGYCFSDLIEQGKPIGGRFHGACLPANEPNPFNSTEGYCINGTQVNDHHIWAYDWCPSPYAWLTLFGLGSYLFFFAPGMGPMPWTINSEIYPIWARSACYSVTTSVNWFFNLIISLTFLSLVHTLTKQGAFIFYAIISLIGFVFLLIFLPETKGTSMDQNTAFVVKSNDNNNQDYGTKPIH